MILDFFQASINGSLFFLSEDKGDNKMPPRPLSQRGIKQMDLQFARRLHAKEVCQEWATWNGGEHKLEERTFERDESRQSEIGLNSRKEWLVGLFPLCKKHGEVEMLNTSEEKTSQSPFLLWDLGGTSEGQ